MAIQEPPYRVLEKKLAAYREQGLVAMQALEDRQTVENDIAFLASSLDEKLVDLHDAARRYTIAGKGDHRLRHRVANAIGQILEHDLTDTERDMVADIVTSLVRQAELDLRQSIAHRVCFMEGVPAEVVLQLAHDEFTVAEPVLEFSPVLTDMDLLYIIRSKPAEYWHAIARRKLLDSSVVDALVGVRDEGTAVNLLLNDAVELKTTALEAFAELTKYSDKLAEPLLRRKELPQKIAMELFWHVAAPLRAHILKNFNIPKNKLDEALHDALADFKDTAEGYREPKPSKLMVDLALQYGRSGRITEAMLIKTLRRGQVRFFVALMAERTGLSHSTIHEIMRQVGGQGMAVACRAVKIQKEDFVSLFLLSRSLTRGDRAVDALELRKAIKYYDALTEEMAVTILANTIIGATQH